MYCKTYRNAFVCQCIAMLQDSATADSFMYAQWLITAAEFASMFRADGPVDEQEEGQRPPHPETHCSYPSFLTNWWFTR